jgi:hypothetical protein
MSLRKNGSGCLVQYHAQLYDGRPCLDANQETSYAPLLAERCGWELLGLQGWLLSQLDDHPNAHGQIHDTQTNTMVGKYCRASTLE